MVVTRQRTGIFAAYIGLLLLIQPVGAAAQTTSGPGASPSSARDGAHDFDWDIGTWKTHQKRLLHPLTGSTTWVDYSGTDIVQRVWGGANTGKIEADGSAGHLEIYTLRLYDPDAHQWNIYFASSAGGSLSKPVVGVFKNGSGEFYDQEPYQGREIFVRFRVYDITATRCRFDQSFSADGGKTWEPNFIVDETLVKPLKAAEAEGLSGRPGTKKT
ncbi:MAG TPA: hypothetical protein VEV38_08635 [Candidatus Eremiobacteraceae bacterium]|nr:hypothetical protein [Candidatus Eremiobacteraceae bacterium]